MNYFFDFKPIPQVPDSTQTNSSFMQQSQQGFMGQESIMSADFSDNSIDSLVKVKTRTRRIRKKKEIQAHKYLDSYLIVKKDSFAFLEQIRVQDYELVGYDRFFPKTDIVTPIYTVSVVDNSVDTLVVQDLAKSNTSFVDTVFSEKLMQEKTDSQLVKVDTSIETLVIKSEEKNLSKTKLHTTEITASEEKIVKNNTSSLSSEIWLMAVLLGTLFLFAFIKMQFRAKLKLYSKALTSYQFFNKMYKEQNSLNQRLAFFLSLLFYINTSLIIYYTLFHFVPSQIELKGFSHFLVILMSLVVIFFSFTFVNKIIGGIFEIYDILNEYLYSLYYYHRILGISLLPIVVLYPYLPDFVANISIYLAWGTVLFLFILRWFRGLQISFKNRVPFLYMILYLCTLEIIPLMFISKMILRLY